MKLLDLMKRLDLQVFCGQDALDRDVTSAYTSDLLSDVMGNAVSGAVWITVQVHLNIVAVASLKELAAIICVKGRRPDEETLEKARSQGVTILGTQRGTFETAGMIWELGVRP